MLDLRDHPNPPVLDEQRLTAILDRGRQHRRQRRLRVGTIAAAVALATTTSGVLAWDRGQEVSRVAADAGCAPDRPPRQGEPRIGEKLSLGSLPDSLVDAVERSERAGFTISVNRFRPSDPGTPSIGASAAPPGVEPEGPPPEGTVSTVDVNGLPARLIVGEGRAGTYLSWSDGDRTFTVFGVFLSPEDVVEAGQGLRYERGRAAPAIGDLGQVLTGEQAAESTSQAPELPLRQAWLLLPSELPQLSSGLGTAPPDEPVWVVLRQAEPGKEFRSGDGTLVAWSLNVIGAATGRSVSWATGPGLPPPELAGLPDHSKLPPCPRPPVGPG